MTAGPKGVAGRPDSLPVQQGAADPLQSYCPDLDQWPGSWAYEPRDVPPGLRMVECFKPFLRELLALSLSRRTLRLHRDNIWVLGGEVIRRLQMDSSLRRQPIQQVVRAHGSCRRQAIQGSHVAAVADPIPRHSAYIGQPHDTIIRLPC